MYVWHVGNDVRSFLELSKFVNILEKELKDLKVKIDNKDSHLKSPDTFPHFDYTVSTYFKYVVKYSSLSTI